MEITKKIEIIADALIQGIGENNLPMSVEDFRQEVAVEYLAVYDHYKNNNADTDPQRICFMFNNHLAKVLKRYSIEKSIYTYLDEDRAYEMNTDRIFIKNLLLYKISGLRPKYQWILLYRYGFVDGFPHTFLECGKTLHIGKESTRQIVAKCLRLMRQPSRSKVFRGLVFDDHWHYYPLQEKTKSVKLDYNRYKVVFVNKFYKKPKEIDNEPQRICAITDNECIAARYKLAETCRFRDPNFVEGKVDAIIASENTEFVIDTTETGIPLSEAEISTDKDYELEDFLYKIEKEAKLTGSSRHYFDVKNEEEAAG